MYKFEAAGLGVLSQLPGANLRGIPVDYLVLRRANVIEQYIDRWE